MWAGWIPYGWVFFILFRLLDNDIINRQMTKLHLFQILIHCFIWNVIDDGMSDLLRWRAGSFGDRDDHCQIHIGRQNLVRIIVLCSVKGQRFSGFLYIAPLINFLIHCFIHLKQMGILAGGGGCFPRNEASENPDIEHRIVVIL